MKHYSFALLGAGRIGRMHADLLARNDRIELRYVYDLMPEVAQQVAEQYNASYADPDSIFADSSLDAVLIASSTDTHLDLIDKAVSAGKAILCEKPLDLDIARIEQYHDRVSKSTAPFQLGFNRRFDPGHQALAEAVQLGQLGELEALVITSRDPAPPPADYIRVSGGLFRDMMIHDFDMARYILGEEPTSIHAIGSVQVDPAIAQLGDIDSAMVTMTTASGTLCHINCSRRAVYGYDQRIEAFGSQGMLLSNNPLVNQMQRYSADNAAISSPLHYFFIERYRQAYENQLAAFLDCISTDSKPAPGYEDGYRALLLANAACESLATASSVALSN